MDDDDARPSSTAATIRRIGDCFQDHDSDGSSSTCSCPQPPLVVLYKCSAGTSNSLVLLLLGLLFGHTMYHQHPCTRDDALKSMAFTAQISYSHEKQFRVIPIIIIIIVVLVVAYSRKVYREFISFLAHSVSSPWVGAQEDRPSSPDTGAV